MTVYETTNHHTVYHWASSRGLWPACVRGQPDRIRLGGDEFSAEDEDLEPIEWWRWFQEFDRRNLQLIYDPSKGWFTLGSGPPPPAHGCLGSWHIWAHFGTSLYRISRSEFVNHHAHLQ